jgi:PAS domain S-box-containing protein
MQQIFWVLDNGHRYIDSLREDLVARGHCAGLVAEIDAFLDDQVSGNAKALIMIHDPRSSVIPVLSLLNQRMVQVPVVVLFHKVDILGATELANQGADLIYPLDMDVDKMHERLAADLDRLGGALGLELNEPTEMSLLDKMENLADWVWRIDEKGCITFSSESVRKVLGYSHTDLKGKVLWKLTPTIEMARFHSQLDDVKQNASEPSALVFVIISKSGTAVHLEGLAMPLFDVDGAYMGMIAACRDVTTHKKAVEDLMIAEDRYSILFESSPDPIITLSPGGRMESINLAGVSLLGATKANELIGRNFYSFIAEGEKNRATNYFNELLRNHEHFQSEFIFQRDNGTSILMEISAAVLLDSTGKPSCVIAILHDASMRNRIAYEFHTNGLHHPHLNLHSQDIFAEIDQDLSIRYLSSNFETITGIPVREVIGKAPFDLMESEDRLNLVEELEPVLSRLQPFFSVRYRARRSDGKVLHFEMNGIPFFDDDNRFRGYRTLVRNVTDRVEKEIALKLEQQKLETIMQNISESIWITDLDFNFLYVSHNLRKKLGLNGEPVDYQDMKRYLDQGSFEKMGDAYKMLANVAKHGINRKSPVFAVETKIIRKDGSHFWSEQKLTLICRDDGEAVGILGIGRDITESKRLEEALRSSEIRQQALLQTIQNEVLVIDPFSGSIIEVNEKCCSELGYSKEELLGKHLSFVLEGWNRDDLATLRDVILRGETAKVEGKHRRKDRTFLDVETCMMAIPWEDRSVILAVASDITESNTLKARLREKGADLLTMTVLAHLSDDCLTAEELLGDSVRTLVDLNHFDAGSVFYFDAVGNLKLIAHHGVPEEGVRLLESGNVPFNDLPRYAASHEPTWMEKASEKNIEAKAWGLESYVVFPLMNGTRSFGAIALGSTRNELIPYERREVLRAYWKQICDSLALIRLKDLIKQEVAQSNLEALRVKN